MSPALAGRFSTTVPPRKPQSYKFSMKDYINTVEALWDGGVSTSQVLRTTLSCSTDLKQSSFAVYNCVTAEEVETQIVFRKTGGKTKKHPIYELIILKGHHERLPDSNISIQF